MNEENDAASRKSFLAPGIAILGCFAAGGISLFAGIAGLLTNNDFSGGGSCFIASAIAFGLAANAIFRK